MRLIWKEITHWTATVTVRWCTRLSGAPLDRRQELPSKLVSNSSQLPQGYKRDPQAHGGVIQAFSNILRHPAEPPHSCLLEFASPSSTPRSSLVRCRSSPECAVRRRSSPEPRTSCPQSSPALRRSVPVTRTNPRLMTTQIYFMYFIKCFLIRFMSCIFCLL